MAVLRFSNRENQRTAPKKQLAAYAGYIQGVGGLPLETTEADIAERYGWTFTELDNEDQDRVYAGYAGQNIRDAIDRIKGWLNSGGRGTLSDRDMRVYGMIVAAEKEITGGNVKAPPKASGVEAVIAVFTPHTE